MSDKSKPFDDLPLAECELNSEERARWIILLAPLLEYANAPGDWGYRSRLGILTEKLIKAHNDLMRGAT